MIGYIVLLTALSISAVAIYYSVAGLVAIFAAATVPIVIMGTALEIGKLVTAVWLHKYWSRSVWWLKTYLSIAILTLMLITSMGIFGFLSKAHIEQTSASQESVAQVERIETEIARQEAIRTRAEQRIKDLEAGNTGIDASVQAQIDREQERIDKAYERVQPAIDEQQRIIDSQAKIYQDELAKINETLTTLQRYIDSGDVAKAQSMVGARADGQWGSRTALAVKDFQTAQEVKRTELLSKIESAGNNAVARAARTEIARIRRSVDDQIKQSNDLINRLRSQVGQKDQAQVQTEVDEQQAKVKAANDEIDTLSAKKYELQAEYRKLEAEVGPVKYIAEFVYGEKADQTILEEAVRWVIIVIIFVFDPLAVLLLIASQYTFKWSKEDEESEYNLDKDDFDWKEYEQERATRINENQGWPWPVDPVKENKDELVQKNSPPEDRAEEAPTENESGNGESDGANTIQGSNDSADDAATDAGTTDDGRDDTHGVDESETAVEDSKKKKSLKSLDVSAPLTEEEKVREAEYLEKELDTRFQSSKTAWKDAHPDQTLKLWKTLYIKGKIDKLPWEDESYKQNSEQNDSTLFNKIKRKDSE